MLNANIIKKRIIMITTMTTVMKMVAMTTIKAMIMII